MQTISVQNEEEMARRRNHKRPRHKNDVLRSCQLLDNTRAFNQDAGFSVVDLDSSDQNLPPPEAVRCEPHQGDPLCYRDLSPEMLPRVPRMSLNLDRPEDDPETKDDVHPKAAKFQDHLLEKTLSIDKMLRSDLEMEEASWKNKYFDSETESARTSPSEGRPSSSENLEKICEAQEFQERRFADEPATSTFLWPRNEQIFPSLDQLHASKTHSDPGQTWEKYSPRSAPGRPTTSRLQPRALCNHLLEPDSIHPGLSKYPDSHENKKLWNRSRSGSPPAKKCRTALQLDLDRKAESIIPDAPDFTFLNIDLGPKHDKEDKQYLTTFEKNWASSSSSPIIDELPTVSDNDCKTIETESPAPALRLCVDCSKCLRTLRTSSLPLGPLRTPLNKISDFFVWLAKKVAELGQKGFSLLRKILLSSMFRSSGSSSPLATEIEQLMTTIRCENENTVSILSEKVTYLSEELVQVRVRSEAALAALTTEVSSMRAASNHLAENNSILTEQLKSMHKTLDNMQTRPSLPPPPPPLPPQPMTPTTPTSSRNIRTPTRKCSTPLQSRPAITVEDLLKVTLKKAPQNVKEYRRNAASGPKGPVVSLDMLRSVKLKSARRRSADQNLSKSPRSKNRPMPSLSLSPIRPGADSPLCRILRQVDSNRRGSKRALSSPTYSETEFPRESPGSYAAIRQSKSHTVIL